MKIWLKYDFWLLWLQMSSAAWHVTGMAGHRMAVDSNDNLSRSLRPEVHNVENCLGTIEIQSKLPAAKMACFQLKTACRQIIMENLHEMCLKIKFLMNKV